MKNIHERLVEERKRLRLNKGQMASAGNVANSTYTNYEDGTRSPDGEFFSSISAAGADVLYILTGRRSAVAMPTATTVSAVSESDLTPRHLALLNNYDHSDEAGKKIIEGTASLAAQSGMKKGKAA